VRDSGIELTEALLKPPVRGAVLGLVEDTPDAERLAAAGPFHTPLGLDYEGVLETMLASSSDSVRLLTVYHIGELGLRSLRAPVEAMARGEDPPGDAVRALHLLAEVAHAG
jgi:hypothetical protein